MAAASAGVITSGMPAAFAPPPEPCCIAPEVACCIRLPMPIPAPMPAVRPAPPLGLLAASRIASAAWSWV